MKKIIILFGMVFLIGFVFAYTAPNYNDIDLVLENDYTAPNYNNIDLVLDEVGPSNCWTEEPGKIIIPPGCQYYTNVKEGIVPS